MISTFLADNQLLARSLLLSGALLALVLAVVLVRTGRVGRRISAGVAIVGGLAVAALTLSPDPSSADGIVTCSLQSFTPLGDLPNVALFLLPALFAHLAIRRPLLSLAAVPLVSAAIELVQMLVPAIGRRCDIDDWIANVVGGVAGVVIAMLVLRLARPRGGSPARDRERVSAG